MSSSEFTDSAVDVDLSIPAPSSIDPAPSSEHNDKGGNTSRPSTQTTFEIDQRPGATGSDLEINDSMDQIESEDAGHVVADSEKTDGSGGTASLDSRPQALPLHEEALDYAGSEHKQDGTVWHKTDTEIDEADIFQVHDNLCEVVASMRLRQQEQRHLHELTVRKVEAVAQRCIFQEQQIQEMLEEIRSLRTENQTLGHDNDKLRDTVAELEADTSRKEIAVSAMTSAVAGLEGWIGDAEKARMESFASVGSVRDGRPRRAVMSGKGRFRGRHYIDHEYDPKNNGFNGPDTQELQEGVKAWIRGFRDVEDACNSALNGRMKELYREPATVEEDDWGDFQAPSGTVR